MALLITDVADIPPDMLERAIQRHVRQSHFMPKASELIALCQAEARRETSGIDWLEIGNRYLASIGKHDCEWRKDADDNYWIEVR